MIVFYSGFQIFSISESKRSSLGGMTFCVKWYLPDKRQIRTRPRLGTSSDFVVLVDLKGFEPTTLRMRTVRSPKRCSSMHHKPHRKLPTIIRYCRRKTKKVYGLVQFFTVQAKKQASCDNQAIFPYYTPPICEMSTQWRRYSSHRGKGMLKNEDFGRYVRIQKHARQSVLFYYHRR